MNNRFSWFSIKKLIVFLIVILVLGALIYMGVLYRSIDHSKVDHKDAVIEFVKESSTIETVTDVDYFVDTEAYDILYGSGVKNKQYLVFNPSGNRDKDELIVIDRKDIPSKAEIEKHWQSTCDGCTLKKSSPAMLEDKALWELTYVDQKENYVMEYFSLEDGSTYEKLRLNKKYR